MTQTTLKAFRQMIETWDIHKELEVDKSDILEMRKKINEHAFDDPPKWGITKEHMHGWLEKAGYKNISGTLWEDNDIS